MAQGIHFFEPLRKADFFNPLGYQENLIVSGINQALLLRSGSFNGDFLNHRRSLGALAPNETAAYERMTASAAHSALGLKCPRFAVTFPAWRKLLRESHSAIRLYICLRNPLDVAASLVAQGRSPNHAILWWASSLVSALTLLDDTDGEVVEFNDDHGRVADGLLQSLAIDLWHEVKLSNRVSTAMRRKIYAQCDANEDWLPIAHNVSRSLAAIRATGMLDGLAGSIEDAFPEIRRALRVRQNYVSSDTSDIWRAYSEYC